jgi:hypothetical protein
MARTIPIHLDQPRDIDVFLNDGDQNSRDKVKHDYVGCQNTIVPTVQIFVGYGHPWRRTRRSYGTTTQIDWGLSVNGH